MNCNTQNAKIESITEKTLIIGIDVGSETHFARAFDWRNYEYSKKAFEFSNTEAGFQSFKAWMEDICKKNGKTDVIPGMEPTGHYWFALGKFLQDCGLKPVHLIQMGFDISYSTVKRLVRTIEDRHEEAFIRQEYEPGGVCEFDWGTVKLDIGGAGYRNYQMAVFTAAYSNNRYARLYQSQDTAAFQESHADYFTYCRGVFHQMTYDNMKVAVKKFVGLTEKEPTEALTQLSLYYIWDMMNRKNKKNQA